MSSKLKAGLLVMAVAGMAGVLAAPRTGWAAATVTWDRPGFPPGYPAVSLGTWERWSGGNFSDPDLDFEGIQSPYTNQADHVGAAPRPWNTVGGQTSTTWNRTAHDGFWAGEYSQVGSGTAMLTLYSRQLTAWLSELNLIPGGETRKYYFLCDFNYTTNREPWYLEMFLTGDTGSFYGNKANWWGGNTGGWLEDRIAFTATVWQDPVSPTTFTSSHMQLIMHKGLTSDLSTLGIDNIVIYRYEWFPEPATAGLLAMAGLTSLRRRRRRNRE